MAELMFLLAFFVPPVVIVLCVAAIAIGSIPPHIGSSALLRERHA